MMADTSQAVAVELTEDDIPEAKLNDPLEVYTYKPCTEVVAALSWSASPSINYQSKANKKVSNINMFECICARCAMIP